MIPGNSTKSEKVDPLRCPLEPGDQTWNDRVIEDFRRNGGRVTFAPYVGANLLLLTSTGARSGAPQVAPLGYTRDGDRYVVVGSNSGRPVNADWVANVRACPMVSLEIGTETFSARGTVTEGAERDRLFEAHATLPSPISGSTRRWRLGSSRWSRSNAWTSAAPNSASRGAPVAVAAAPRRYRSIICRSDSATASPSTTSPFEVGRGEVFGFLGPNGAGKTTTVRTLGTLIAPTSGSATVAGIPLTPENGVEIRRRISIMPESPGLYLRLSVIENLECFADLYEVPDPSDRIDRALRAVNLADRARDACGTLSKGLRQRVALARALLSDPEVLFLDEPTSGLDPVAARDVHELIDGLRKRGVTIFLTTHRLEEAERLCDRVAILNTTLRTIGRPDELRDRLFAKTLTVRTRRPLPEPGRRLRRSPGRRRLAPGRPRHLRPGRVRPGSRRTGRHPRPGGGRGRRAVDQRVAPLARGRLPRADRRGHGGGPAMSMSGRRIRAIVRKELREYRRNRSVVVTMAIFPLIFLIQPLVVVLRAPESSSATLGQMHLLLYMLAIPVLVPAAVAASAVAGERQQGSLEPVLTTPIRREEFLLGKALAALVPSIAIAYAVYAVFVACAVLFAQPAVASAILQGPDILAQVLFTPLLAFLSIWVGIAISTRSSDVRVAQQLSLLGKSSGGRGDIAHRVRRDPRDARPRACPRGCCSSPTPSAGGSCPRCSTASGSSPSEEVLLSLWANAPGRPGRHGPYDALSALNREPEAPPRRPRVGSQATPCDCDRLRDDVPMSDKLVGLEGGKRRADLSMAGVVGIEMRDEGARVDEHPTHQGASPAIFRLCRSERSPVPEWNLPAAARARMNVAFRSP